MTDPVRQVELSQGNSHLTAWVDADARLKPGVIITLKDGPPGLWAVEKVHAMRLERAACHKPWRVGGLM